MCIYEQGDKDLHTQVRHWQLIRHEQVLLHAARQQGHTRIGMQAVPPLAATQANAKAAIEMHLLLQSLAQSHFAKEPWTLSETSRDMYLAAPAQTFKKSGQTIEVTFDGDKDNSMQYTKWRQVFFTDDRGVWHRVPSVCDVTGIFYERQGQREYYVRFEKEAAKYSLTGVWEASDEGKIYTSVVPITSSTPTPGFPGGSAVRSDGLSTAGYPCPHRDPECDCLLPEAGRRGDSTKTEAPQRPEYADHSYNRTHSPFGDKGGGGGDRGNEAQEAQGRGGSGGPGSGEGPAGVRGGLPSGDGSKRSPSRETCPSSQGTQPISKVPRGETEAGETATRRETRSQKRAAAGVPRGQRRKRGKRKESSCDVVDLGLANACTPDRGHGLLVCEGPSPAPPNLTPLASPPRISVARQGRTPGTPRSPPTLVAVSASRGTRPSPAARARSGEGETPRRTRSHRTHLGPPCLLIVKGTPNGVKCLRYRLKSQHPGLFQYVSTTWQWVPSSGSARVGRARILIMCSDEVQRRAFLDTVKIPGGMTVEQCSMLSV